MKRWMKVSALLLLAGGVALTAWAANSDDADDSDEGEEMVALEDLPAAVRAAVQAAAPGGQLLEAEKETEDGAVVYEVEVRLADGRLVDITVTPDGQVLEIEDEDEDEADDDDDGEESIAPEALPTAVKAAVQAVAPSGRIVKASTERENGVLVFEVEVETADGGEMEIAVTAEGNVLEIEEALLADQLPAAVQRTLAHVLPGGSTAEVEKKMIVVYEIEKTIDGVEYELVIDQVGRILSISSDDED